MNPELLLRGARRGFFALYFEGGVFGAIAAFSTWMSSPWTIERTAKAPEASDATRKYTWMAHGFNLGMGAFVSLLAGSVGPLLGTSVGTLIMGLVYRYARAQGLEHASFDIAGFDHAAAAPTARRRR